MILREQDVALLARPVPEGCHQLLCQRGPVQTRPDGGAGVREKVRLRPRSALLEGVWTHNGRYGAYLTISARFILAGLQLTADIMWRIHSNFCMQLTSSQCLWIRK